MSSLDIFSGGYFINITLNSAPFSVMMDTVGVCVLSPFIHLPPSPLAIHPRAYLALSAFSRADISSYDP